jgi:hypothetical protein
MIRRAAGGVLMIVLALMLAFVAAAGLVGAVAAQSVLCSGTGVAALGFTLMLATLSQGLDRLGRALAQK